MWLLSDFINLYTVLSKFGLNTYKGLWNIYVHLIYNIIRWGLAHFLKIFKLQILNDSFISQFVANILHCIIFRLTAFGKCDSGPIPPICKTKFLIMPRNVCAYFIKIANQTKSEQTAATSGTTWPREATTNKRAANNSCYTLTKSQLFYHVFISSFHVFRTPP